MGTNAYGMNWIRQEKRLAIYLRDGCACAYCGRGVEQGAKLTLDHLEPESLGGGHEATNLVTSCLSCNSSRQATPLRKFARRVAGVKWQRLERSIYQKAASPIDRAGATKLIARRGSAAKAIKSM
jgi:5-methylcytosine-specific restriction endonuclease McrA